MDIRALAQYHALCDVGRIDHGQAWHNQRLYYNPISARLEPIAFDLYTESEVPKTRPVIMGLVDAQNESIVIDRFLNFQVFNQPAFQTYYLEYLKKFSDESFLIAQIERLQPEIDSLSLLLKTEFSGYTFTTDEWLQAAANIRELIPTYESQIQLGQAKFRMKTTHIDDLSSKPVYFSETGLKAYMSEGDSSYSEIECRNYHTGPLQIIGYSLKGNSKEMMRLQEPVLLDAYTENEHVTPLVIEGHVGRLFFKLPAFPDSVLSKKVVRWAYPNQTNVRLELERLGKRYPPGIEIKGNQIVVKSDIHLNYVLFIPENHQLVFRPGVSVVLGKGGGILSYGPVLAHGSASRRITIQGVDSRNHGVQVLTAGDSSSFSFVDFKGLSSLNYKGWALTGGLTVYQGVVDFNYCNFQNNTSEDAVNLVNSTFVMENCSITKTYSDGLDTDFCTGTVRNCTVAHTGNDGLDFSGSTITVSKTRVTQPGDKAISVGENSQVKILDCDIKDALFGVVAKDLSTAWVQDSRFFNCTTVYAAFSKKDQYGPAKIIADNSPQTHSGENNLVGTGSSITIDGVKNNNVNLIHPDSLYLPVSGLR